MATDRIQRRIDRLLDEADEAFARGAWGDVRENAQKVLLLDADNADAGVFLEAANRATSGTAEQPDFPEKGTASKQEQLVSFANDRYRSRSSWERAARRRFTCPTTVSWTATWLAGIKTEGFDETFGERITRVARAMVDYLGHGYGARLSAKEKADIGGYLPGIG